MKKFYSFFICSGLLFAATIQPAAAQGLIARIHFAGAQKISADPNSTAFTNEFCSAEAKALENQTLDKLSRTSAAWFKTKLPAGAGDGSAQLRPLLDDLLKSEWLFEMRDAKNGSPEYALAIHLDNARAQLWQNNLQNVLLAWTKLPVQKKTNGWELRKHEPPNLFRVERHGDWTVIDCGENELSLGNEILGAVNSNPRVSETNWLTADLNWPQLAQLFPVLAKFDFPKIAMEVVGRNGNLKFNGKLNLLQPLPPLEKWCVPTNLLHQPFISFTAVRGITPWLEKQSWARKYEISLMPQQFFAWALPQIPFQTFAAAPLSDAKSALMQLDSRLPKPAAPAAGPLNFLSMPIKANLTNDEILFQGIPFASPYLKAQRELNGNFLFGGFFPNTPRSQPLPPELFTRLATPNLVFYHWEVTAERLKSLPQLAQLLLLVSHHRQLAGDSAAYKWLTHIGPTLGNSVTEAIQTGSNEITFTRTAPGGLTAVELFALASWLEAPNFPGCDLTLPARPMNLMHPHVKIPGAPAPTPFQLHQLH